MAASILKRTVFSIQVCVPKTWTDEQVIAFAENDSPCGTRNGWLILKQGDEQLRGADERVECVDDSDNCHIVLVA